MTVRDLLDTSISSFDYVWINNVANSQVFYRYELDKIINTANDLLLSSEVVSWYTQIRKIDIGNFVEIVIMIK